jgi:serine/threonine protein kinase
MRPTCDAGLRPGDSLDDRYVVGECVGVGGMGSVFLASEPGLGRTVAIKVPHARFPDRTKYVALIHDEAMAGSSVRSPHCVSMIGHSMLPDGTPYLVMEHVPGRSLRQVIKQQPVSPARAIGIFSQILAAITATHSSGLVHADVKSSNFLVGTVDGRDHVTLIDFGLARVAGTRSAVELMKGPTAIVGTPEYMAPEVVCGEPPTRASDLYAAGIILYELLTGSTPFHGGTARQIMYQHVHVPIERPSSRRPDRQIPVEIDQLVLRALDKRPEARFTDATQFARALGAATAAWEPEAHACGPSADIAAADSSPGRASTWTPPRRQARGSDRHDEVRSLDRSALHQAIRKALNLGDVTQSAARYIELASLLGRKGYLAAAARERQEDRHPDRGDGPDAVATAPVDRRVVALAAIHEDAGESVRARAGQAGATGRIVA